MIKRKIADTFIDLCNKYPVDKITVKQIIEAAGVSKQTFYNHFKDKYDLIAWDFVNDLSPTFDFDAAEYSVDQLKRCLEIMEGKRLYYRKVFSTYEQNSLISYHLEEMIRFIVEMVKRHYQVDILTHEIQVAVKLYCYGGTAVFLNWLKNDTQITPDELAKAIYNSMPNIIRETWK